MFLVHSKAEEFQLVPSTAGQPPISFRISFKGSNPLSAILSAQNSVLCN